MDFSLNVTKILEEIGTSPEKVKGFQVSEPNLNLPPVSQNWFAPT